MGNYILDTFEKERCERRMEDITSRMEWLLDDITCLPATQELKSLLEDIEVVCRILQSLSNKLESSWMVDPRKIKEIEEWLNVTEKNVNISTQTCRQRKHTLPEYVNDRAVNFSTATVMTDSFTQPLFVTWDGSIRTVISKRQHNILQGPESREFYFKKSHCLSDKESSECVQTDNCTNTTDGQINGEADAEPVLNSSMECIGCQTGLCDITENSFCTDKNQVVREFQKSEVSLKPYPCVRTESPEETNSNKTSLQSSASWQRLHTWLALNDCTLGLSTRHEPGGSNENLFLKDALPNDVAHSTSCRSEPEQCVSGLQYQVQQADEYALDMLMVRFDVEKAPNLPPAAQPHEKIPDCQLDWPEDTRNLDQWEN